VAKQPAKIDKYELIRRLGRGGMGTVYLARDPVLDRLVAIKLLRDPLSDDELLQRFLREARAAARLRHDNIITVYDVGQHDQQPFMAMEYVDGTSLAEVIATRQPLALDEKLSYLEQLCAGLHHAHGQGLVHRDVKPANVMVDARRVIRVLDFGIARVEGSDMTRDGDLMGTLSYMSPEQMLGRAVDYRTDIFAVGAVAYELLAYQQALGGPPENGMPQRRAHEDIPPLAGLCPGLPADLEPLVMQAMAKDPEQRFSNLEQVRAAIREIRRSIDPGLRLEPIVPSGYAPTIVAPRSSSRGGSRPPAVAAQERAPSNRRWVAIAAAVVVVLALGVGAAVWMRPAVEAPAARVGPPAPAPVAPEPAPPVKTPEESAPEDSAPEDTAPPRESPVTPPPPKPVVEPDRPRTTKPIIERETVTPALTTPVVTPSRESASSPVTTTPAATEPAPPPAAPPPATTTAAPPAAATPSLLDQERGGIMTALTQYQRAYQARSVEALEQVFPNFKLQREERQRLVKNFDNCREYDVAYTNLQPLINPDDPGSVLVRVRTVYTCVPKGRQPPIQQSVNDVFSLRKFGSSWLIESRGAF
jgi:serine/threonine protein kinase